MKILTFNILLLTANAVLAAQNEADSGEELSPFTNNNNKNTFSSNGNSFFSSGQSSHSVINANGNSVVVSKRFVNGKEENYISTTNPKIRIDGEYCKSKRMRKMRTIDL